MRYALVICTILAIASPAAATQVIYTVDSNAPLYTIDPQTGVETAAVGGAPGFVSLLSVGAPTLYESATVPITVTRIAGIAPAAGDNTGVCRLSSSAASAASPRE